MIRDLLTPEAQTSPYVWAAVLLAHFGIGAMLWLAVGLPAIGVYAAFEALQAVVARRALWWDSVLDWCGVVLGALMMGWAVSGAYGAALACAAACLCIAAVGYRARSGE